MSSDVEAEPKAAQENQQFLTEFIDVYRSFTCLWKYSCKDYRNREVKEHAYEALVEKMRESDPWADKNSVMRKINALRTAFRREFKKVRKAALQARSVGPRCRTNKYMPTLWYYDLLKFVVDQQDFSEPAPGSLITEWPSEPPMSPITSYITVDENGQIVDHNSETCIEYSEDAPSIQAIKIEATSPPSSRPGTPSTQAISANNASTSGLGLEINSVYSEKAGGNVHSSSTKRDEPVTTAASRKRRFQHAEEQSVNEEPDEKVEQQMKSLQSRAQQPLDPENASHLCHFETYVIAKLKKSSAKQCIIAEKIIAEVLMRANLGTLDEETTLTDVKAPQNNHST